MTKYPTCAPCWRRRCPALPTCGLAITESERILPTVIGELEKKVEENYCIEDVDMTDSAAYLWDKIEPTLINAGYNLSECEFSRADVIIQTNQNVDFKREVTKSASVDPITGDVVPTDMAYLSRMRTLAGMPWNK